MPASPRGHLLKTIKKEKSGSKTISSLENIRFTHKIPRPNECSNLHYPWYLVLIKPVDQLMVVTGQWAFNITYRAVEPMINFWALDFFLIPKNM